MKRLFALSLAILCLGSGYAQLKKEQRTGKIVGASYTLHDFNTAADLSNMSLSAVVEKGDWNKARRMRPGFALTSTPGLPAVLAVLLRSGTRWSESRSPGVSSLFNYPTKPLVKTSDNSQNQTLSA